MWADKTMCGKRQHYDFHFTNGGQSQEEILENATTYRLYRKYMDEVAPNSEKKRQSVVLYLRVQKSLVVWLFRVGKWAQDEKILYGFHSSHVKTDEIEVH